MFMAVKIAETRLFFIQFSKVIRLHGPLGINPPNIISLRVRQGSALSIYAHTKVLTYCTLPDNIKRLYGSLEESLIAISVTKELKRL